MFQFVKTLIPRGAFLFFQPLYHRFLALLAAILYRFPSRKLTVIGVTGTNGKSTTVELLAEIIEEAGYRVASTSSIRFRIADREHPNDLKMTMPGRFFMQKFLRNAVTNGCTHAVLEVTSEGIKQFRHRYIKFDVAVITNITPEHIESHGSFEKYRAAKAELFKRAPIHVLNEDDPNTYALFSRMPAQRRASYKLKEYPRGFHLHLPGDFNRANALAALTAAQVIGISYETAKRAVERIDYIPGRLEVLQEEPFGVIVDYAHTPDALEKVYKELSAPRFICVLGSAGGGRDAWKRPEMGKVAAEHCDYIILTNEDPYDENPEKILEEIEKGIRLNSKFPARHASQGEAGRQIPNSKKILDRREAIRAALEYAKKDDVVVITGKGCEQWIMGPNGVKIPWDDREVVREEIKNLKIKM